MGEQPLGEHRLGVRPHLHLGIDGCDTTQHDGVHTFYVGRGSKVRYTEKHHACPSSPTKAHPGWVLARIFGKISSRGPCSDTIEISSKEDKPGIDIRIKAGTRGQDVHIPVLLTRLVWSTPRICTVSSWMEAPSSRYTMVWGFMIRAPVPSPSP